MLTRTIKARLICLTSIILMLAMGITRNVPAQTQMPHAELDSSQMIRMDRDLNADGIPNELVERVDRIRSAEDTDLANAELIDLLKRLPYSAKTHRLQRRIVALQEQLGKATDYAEAEKIMARLESVSARMMDDPNYANTIKAIDKLFKVGSNDSADDGTEAAQLQAQGVNFGGLLNGDVMLIRSQNPVWQTFLYAMTYTHAGTYDKYVNLVYESRGDGVKLNSLDSWRQPGTKVALGHSRYIPAATMDLGLYYAEVRYGTNGRTPYNYRFDDKNRDDALYCSQLVWKIHKSMGIDLDSNDRTYLIYTAVRWFGAGGIFGPIGSIILGGAAVYFCERAVAPDEIRASNKEIWYSEAWQ